MDKLRCRGCGQVVEGPHKCQGPFGVKPSPVPSELSAGLECSLSDTGFGLAYYRGAMDAALRECEIFEKSLGLDGQSKTWIYHRLQQMNGLLKKLEAL